MTPLQQTQKFVQFMLEHAPEMEFAAAHYVLLAGMDKSKVDWLRESRLRVRSLDDLGRLLPWLRAQNASEGLNIWVRPASSLAAHPFILLDDLASDKARAVLRKYRGAAVETSSANHQVLLCCGRDLTREQRQDVARCLCKLIGSDPGAISEPRWGRLPGFKQTKPEKVPTWTNLLSISSDAALFDPTPYSQPGGGQSLPAPWGAAVVPSPSGADTSRREFGYACHALRAGVDPERVEQRIAARVAASGRHKSRDYAARTVAAAQRAVGSVG